jgi:hypothetical protein
LVGGGADLILLLELTDRTLYGTRCLVCSTGIRDAGTVPGDERVEELTPLAVRTEEVAVELLAQTGLVL